MRFGGGDGDGNFRGGGAADVYKFRVLGGGREPGSGDGCGGRRALNGMGFGTRYREVKLPSNHCCPTGPAYSVR